VAVIPSGETVTTDVRTILLCRSRRERQQQRRKSCGVRKWTGMVREVAVGQIQSTHENFETTMPKRARKNATVSNRCQV
jgi:hypothetical protein